MIDKTSASCGGMAYAHPRTGNFSEVWTGNEDDLIMEDENRIPCYDFFPCKWRIEGGLITGWEEREYASGTNNAYLEVVQVTKSQQRCRQHPDADTLTFTRVPFVVCHEDDE